MIVLDVLDLIPFLKGQRDFHSPVRPNRVRKSIEVSEPMASFYNEDDIKAELTKNARRVAESAQKIKKLVESLAKVRYSDFDLNCRV